MNSATSVAVFTKIANAQKPKLLKLHAKLNVLLKPETLLSDSVTSKESAWQRSTKLISDNVTSKEFAKQIQLDPNSLPNEKLREELLNKELPWSLGGNKIREIVVQKLQK